MKKVYIIDFMNIAFRNYHAFEKMNLRTSEGIPTGTLFGVTTFLVNLIKNESPDYIAVAMESDTSFRKEILSSYKSNRGGKPSDFEEHLASTIQMFETLGIPMIRSEGHEADDVIGCLVKQFKKEDCEIFIVSGDKDFMQLVDDNVKLFIPKSKGMYTLAGKQAVHEKFGCKPSQVIDVLALMGDKVDCIPGVNGIGPKGASKLVTEFGSLSGVYASEEALAKSTTKSQYEKLIKGQSDAFMSYRLATIVTDRDLKTSTESMAFDVNSIEEQHFSDFLDTYELSSIKNKIKVKLMV